MSRMERFWDARAREDPYYFVDSRLRYGAPDDEAFWAGGEDALANLLGVLSVDIPPGQVVADIGCGLGRLTRPLARRAAEVIAIDISKEMLARARELNPQLANVSWLHGDGESLRPMPDASVDVCISHVVFRHIPDPQITLGYVAEMGRVLREGGFAAFELSNDPRPHRHRPKSWRELLAGLAQRGPKGGNDAAWLGSHVDLDELSAAAKHAKLAVAATAGEGSEFCAVLLRRVAPDERAPSTDAGRPLPS